MQWTKDKQDLFSFKSHRSFVLEHSVVHRSVCLSARDGLQHCLFVCYPAPCFLPSFSNLFHQMLWSNTGKNCAPLPGLHFCCPEGISQLGRCVTTIWQSSSCVFDASTRIYFYLIHILGVSFEEPQNSQLVTCIFCLGITNWLLFRNCTLKSV